MGKRSAVLCLGVLMLALLGVGCGGGGEETATAQIAKPAFVAKAQAICEKTYTKVQGEYEQFVKENGETAFDDLDSMEEYTDDTLIPAREQQLEEVRDLGVPPGDEEKVEAILVAYEKGLDEADEDPENAVTSAYGPFVPAAELLKAYGADCRY